MAAPDTAPPAPPTLDPAALQAAHPRVLVLGAAVASVRSLTPLTLLRAAAGPARAPAAAAWRVHGQPAGCGALRAGSRDPVVQLAVVAMFAACFSDSPLLFSSKFYGCLLLSFFPYLFFFVFFFLLLLVFFFFFFPRFFLYIFCTKQMNGEWTVLPEPQNNAPRWFKADPRRNAFFELFLHGRYPGKQWFVGGEGEKKRNEMK